MKLLKTFLLLILVLVLVFAVGKNLIAKLAIENGVKVATGLPLAIRNFNMSFTKTMVDVRGIVLGNPRGFNDKVFVDLPQIYFDFDLPALFKGKIHIEAIKVHLKELQIIKAQGGKLNVDVFKPAPTAAAPKAKPAPAKGKSLPIEMDLFELKVGKVIYKDYTVGTLGGAPLVKEFNINLDEQFKDVKSVDALVKIITVKALEKTTIGQLINLDIGSLASSVSGTLATSTKVVATQLGDAAQETLQQASQQAADSMAQTQANLKNLAGEVVTSPNVLVSEIKGGTGNVLKQTGTGAKQAAQSVEKGAAKLTSGLASVVKNPFGSKTTGEQTQQSSN